MGIFNNKKDMVSELQSRSQGVLNIFHTTINELQSINDEISHEENERAEQIVVLSNEKGNLKSQRESNETLITKMSNFLN